LLHELHAGRYLFGRQLTREHVGRFLRIELRAERAAHVVSLASDDLRVDRRQELVHAVEALRRWTRREPLEVAVGPRDVAVGARGDVDDDFAGAFDGLHLRDYRRTLRWGF